MKRIALLLAASLLIAWTFLRVPPIEPTRPFATCEDRRAW